MFSYSLLSAILADSLPFVTHILCISNDWQSTKNETNKNKINDSAIMKVSAENPATTYTHVRYP